MSPDIKPGVASATKEPKPLTPLEEAEAKIRKHLQSKPLGSGGLQAFFDRLAINEAKLHNQRAVNIAEAQMRDNRERYKEQGYEQGEREQSRVLSPYYQAVSDEVFENNSRA